MNNACRDGNIVCCAPRRYHCMLKTKIILNTLLLTCVSLLLRCVGLYFQVILTDRLGTEGLGLFQLVLSVHTLAVTVAVSGIRYAAARLVSEELGAGRPSGVRGVMLRCLTLALVCGAVSCTLVRMFAVNFAAALTGEPRVASSLRVLAFGLPFLALSSAISGYFTAVLRVAKASEAQVLEQVSMIALTLILLPAGSCTAIEEACVKVCIAAVAADVLSFIVSLVLYLHDRAKYGESGGRPAPDCGRRLAGLAIPLALTSYARTALSTLRHVLVPKGLERHGYSPEKALSAFGTLHGMTFPVLTFPSALFYAVSDVLIPNLTEAQMRGNTEKAGHIVSYILRLCFVFSVGVSAVFLAFGNELALAVFKNRDAGNYIVALSPLVLVMYMDSVADGMLKGLGEQFYSMLINIADAAMSLLLVFYIIPAAGMRGYLAIILFSECFNFTLSMRRLSKTVPVSVSARDIFSPPLCAAAGICIARAVLQLCGLGLIPSGFSCVLHIVFSGLIYAALLRSVSPATVSLSFPPL